MSEKTKVTGAQILSLDTALQSQVNRRDVGLDAGLKIGRLADAVNADAARIRGRIRDARAELEAEFGERRAKEENAYDREDKVRVSAIIDAEVEVQYPRPPISAFIRDGGIPGASVADMLAIVPFVELDVDIEGAADGS